ncbi:MAG TPA: hypothetical protein VKB27_08560 [Gammaproteobacteria bacterium]|nr:hypothetical protein [Gammaproteobacteria bacterium]
MNSAQHVLRFLDFDDQKIAPEFHARAGFFDPQRVETNPALLSPPEKSIFWPEHLSGAGHRIEH